MRRRLLTAGMLIASLGLFAGPAAAIDLPQDATIDQPKDESPDAALFAEPTAGEATLARGTSTVTVSKSADLTRQMLTVSWTGMPPQVGTASDVYNTTYPLMVMQCRGHNPSREDCWSGGFLTRGDQSGGTNGQVIANHYLPAETSQWMNPINAFGNRTMEIPFRKADGSYLAKKNANGSWKVAGLGQAVEGIAPVDDYTPATANYRLGQTAANGTGLVQIWANTGFENPSLGCSDKSPCSMVVVPVKKAPCNETLPKAALDRCKATHNNVTDPRIEKWQLLSNWHQRYVFKLSFSPRVAKCDQRDDSAALFGSELVAEAMRRWVPARCQSSSPAGLDYTRGWEPEGRRLIGTGDPVAQSGYTIDSAVVTEPAAKDETVTTKRKPAYAPTAVSGFAIGYNWDKGASGPVADMRLNPRLVAKLITQSYPGKYRPNTTGWSVNPNTGSNSAVLVKDPEFIKLNPGADTWAGFAGSVGTQLALPVAKTDIILALTRWLWSDPEARAFLQGKPDPWGMRVNKTYLGWEMPRDDYQLNDGWVIPADAPLDIVNRGYAPQQLGAQTASSLAQSADVLMSSWPLSQYVTFTDPNSNSGPRLLKRVDGQLIGNRNIVALSTTSELAKVGMRMAALENHAGEFVLPDTRGLAYALDGATVDQTSGVWRINHAAMDKRGYPGTMISYAMVPTTGLKENAAKRYAGTIRWMSTDAQRYGSESGQLPDGYLALTDPMRAQAARVAEAVEKQSGTVPKPPNNEDPLPPDKDPTPDDKPKPNPDDPNDDDPQPTPTPTTSQQPDDNSGNGNDNNNDSNKTAPTTVPTGANGMPNQQAGDTTKPVSATTEGESLGWLAWGIPAMLLAGVLAGVAAPGIRVIAQPGHPVRRAVAGLAWNRRRGRRRA